MNNVTKIVFQLSIVLASASLAAAPLPKEGPVNATSCFVGDRTLMEASKESQFGSVTFNGLRFAQTEGGFGDISPTFAFVTKFAFGEYEATKFARPLQKSECSNLN